MSVTNKADVSTSPKLYGLDHLRSLAIILVFLFHYQKPMFGYPAWLPPYGKFGWSGVDLFFVLSGFLISSQLFAQLRSGAGVSLKEFFLKRFFRIIPAYWLVLAIYFCVPAFHEREALSSLWKFLTFTQNFGLNLAIKGTFSHAWSLCVEEHFYLFLPLVLILLSSLRVLKFGVWLLPALFISGFFIRHYCWTSLYQPFADAPNAGALWFQFVYYPTYNRLDGLLAGVSIAALYQFAPKAWDRIAQYGNAWIVLGLLILTIGYIYCDDLLTHYGSVYGFPLVAIGYGCMVIGAVSPSSFLYKWNSGVTAFIAMLSYGIYLTHKGVIHVTQALLAPFGIDAGSSLMMVICVVACVLAAWILNLAIEKPFMRWRKKILN